MKLPSFITAALLAIAAAPALALSSNVIPANYQWLTLAVFAAVIALTLAVTYAAARHDQTAAEFYTAGGGISGIKNGLAITGDYLSAAAFLGVSGLISIYGFDGILYLVGFFVAFVPVLLLVAEPCRNLGKYTLGDVLASRNDLRSSKFVAAISGTVVSIFYLIPQIVGGAVVIKALVGVEYEVSVFITGALMLVYVVFGGMRATTWVQIIKAVLLLSTCFILVILSWAPFGFSVHRIFDALASSPALQAHLAALPSAAGSSDTSSLVQKFFEPGLFLTKPIEQLSLGLALILGTAAMPHILMRFFTVPDAKTARSSVLWAMLLIGGCHLLIIAIGFSAAHYVGALKITALDKGGNLAAPLLAQFLGGGADSLMGNFLLAFVAAVAFATIVAVVAGLTLAAAASLAHDIYCGTIKNGNATPREQVVAAKICAVIVGVVSIGCALLAKGQNVAHLVALAFAVAASANFPALLMTLYWKRCNTTGVLAGVIGGTLVSIFIVMVSPNMQYPALLLADAEKSLAKTTAQIAQFESSAAAATTPEAKAKLVKAIADGKTLVTSTQQRIEGLRAGPRTSIVGLEKPLVDLRNPGLISVPIGFLLVILGSLFGRAGTSSQVWDQMRVRRYTGLGRAGATSH